MIYIVLKHAHSGLRWLALIVLIYAILNSLFNFLKNTDFRSGDKKINVFALGILHTQLILGLALYFVSPLVKFSGESMSNPLLRFYLVEHLSMMFLAAALLTVGFIRSKRIHDARGKHRAILVFYSLSLLILFLAIPWPWLNLGGSWF